MSELPKLLSNIATVRFPDCDPYNHLNNAKYIDYFFNAREDHVLKAYDLNVYDLAKTKGVAWVVAQNQIAYLRPALLMERVGITSRVIRFNRRGMDIEFQMLKEGTQSIKALMWSSLAHVDVRSGASVDHSPEIMSMFESVNHPVEEHTFAERLASFRRVKPDQN